MTRLRNTVDEKYRARALKQGIELKIAYQPGFPKAQKIVAHDGSFTIQLNSDVIDEADYETYLSYNVRKIVLPRLRLETDRLVLRPFGRDDAEAYFAFCSDWENAWMDSGEVYSHMDDGYARLMVSFADQLRCSILLKESNHVIGTIHLMDVTDRAVETMEIGYNIAPRYKRRGYAFEALSALLHELLWELNLDMVIAGAFPDNVPSLALLEKLGFQYEGLRHKAFWNPMRGPTDLKYYYLEKPSAHEV